MGKYVLRVYRVMGPVVGPMELRTPGALRRARLDVGVRCGRPYNRCKGPERWSGARGHPMKQALVGAVHLDAEGCAEPFSGTRACW